MQDIVAIVRRVFAVAAFGVLVSSFGLRVAAAQSAQRSTGGATVRGTLVATSGIAIGGATVVLRSTNASRTESTTTSDPSGRFAFENVVRGAYVVEVRALGYAPTEIAGVAVSDAGTTTVRAALNPSGTTGGGDALREIAVTTVRASGNSLASSATIQHDLDPAQLQSQGFLNAVAAIGQIPGINLSGGQHTAGDDTSIDIRGMGPGEVRPLIDGHPIGPIGVLSPDYYDYANSPYFLMRNIQTTVGSGAAGLYGVDVIGGTIDFQTLDPTHAVHGELYQAAGNQGTGISEAKLTGSTGRLGFALGHTVTGTYNDFEPGLRFQSARPNNNSNLNNGGACLPGAANDPAGYPDVSSCNAALNTYSVSGNYRVQNDLVKLRYAFDDATSLTIAAYAANQLSDSTGNGDNDALPYDTRLAEILTSPSQCGTGGYYAVTNASNAACLSPQQIAAASYGPDGGGADRNRGTTLQDYNARFTTTVAKNTITADLYRDFYEYRKNSNQAAGLDSTGTSYVGGGTYDDAYLTNGLLLSDEITGAKNDFGFGYFVEHQREFGNDFSAGPPATFVDQPELGEGDYSFFLREQYIPSDKISLFANAWSRRSNVTEHTTFDPRVSIVVKPTARDVVRLTAGRADGDPAAAVKSAGTFTNIGNPSSLNPSCTLLNPVAQGGNPNLISENANDLEGALGHRFWSDTSVNLVGYVSSERNQLFNGVAPIANFGASALQNPVLAPLFAQYAQKIQAACPSLGALDATSVLPYLGITTTFNAASALYRGLELSGRLRVAPIFYVDYDYDVQSSRQTGISNTLLANNPLLLNDAQIYAIPVHKGSLTLDYDDLHGVESQLEGYYTGPNNDLNRVGYTFFNAFVSKKLGKTLTATISAENVFDQNVQTYGYFGHQLTAPVNAFAPAPSPALAAFPSNVAQAATLGNGTAYELLGLPPRLVTISLSAKM